MRSEKRVRRYCGLVFIWCCSVASVIAQSQTQVARFEGRNLQTWATHAMVEREYVQLKLTSDQVDALYENQIAWQHVLGAEGRRNRAYLRGIYDVLDESQDQRLDQILFQKWMNRGQLGPAMAAFVPDHGIENFGRKLSQLRRDLTAIERKHGLKKTDRGKSDFEQRLAQLFSERWHFQLEWLRKELGENRTTKLVGEAFVDRPSIQQGRRMSYGSHANPATGELVSMSWNRPVDIPDGWKLADAQQALANRRDAVKQVIAKFEERIEVAKQDVERSRKAEQERARLAAAARPPNPGMGRMGGGIMGGGIMGGGLMGGRMGGISVLPIQLRMKIEREARLESQRASFEIDKLYRIIEELGGPPLSKAHKAQSTFRRHWPVASNSRLFQSNINATAKQCDQLDALWENYGEKLRNGSKEKRDEIQSSFERELVVVLDKSQVRRVKQLKFRQLWYSHQPEEAFSVTKIQLTEDDRTRISELVAKLVSAHEADRRDRDRPFMLRQLGSIVSETPQQWLDLEKDFNDTLVEIVGERQAKVLLGDPMVMDRNWKRPVDASGMTIVQAEQSIREIEQKLELLEKLEEELEARSEAEFEAEESNDDLIEQLDAQISELQSQRGLFRKKLQRTERVLEETRSR